MQIQGQIGAAVIRGVAILIGKNHSLRQKRLDGNDGVSGGGVSTPSLGSGTGTCRSAGRCTDRIIYNSADKQIHLQQKSKHHTNSTA